MRTIFAALLAAILAIAPTIALTQTDSATHRPPPCASRDDLPNFMLCPHPFVQLVAKERDPLFASAWYCEATGRSALGFRGSDNACGADHGIPDGWAIPAAQAATSVDYRAEIVAHVVDSCILGMTRARPEFAAVADEDIIALMKLTSPGAWDQMTEATVSVVTGKEAAARALVYKLFLAECIRAGTSGS